MSELTLRGGELVDITIRGARVADTAIGMLAVTYRGGEVRVELVTSSAVTVTRVAPAEWPPLVGDLWRDRDGVVWFATDRYDHPWMVNALGNTDSAGSMLADRGPMRLVHREARDAEIVAAALESPAGEPS